MAFFDDPELHDFPDRAIRRMQAHAAHLRELIVAVSPAIAEPIVLHTGHRPWSAPRTLRQLMGGPEEFHAYVPDWRPLFFDLAEHTAEELLNRPGEWLPALAAVRAERDDPERFLEVLAQALRHLEPLRRQDENRWRELLHFLFSWGLRRRPLAERESLYTTVVASREQADTRAEVEAMAERMFVMAEDELRAQGLAVGKEQGKQEGLAAGKKQGLAAGKKQGELSALRTTLRELLTDRFGDVSAALTKRIDACAAPKRLRAAILQVLHIQSADQLTL